MSTAKQLTLLEPLLEPESPIAEKTAAYGEVFTRRWVVEFILDLVGYSAEADLGATVLIEPACGAGAFLQVVVERLVASARRHGRPLESLARAIRAFDLQPSNVQLSRKAAATLLVDHGVSPEIAEAMASNWILEGDFLLDAGETGAADFVVGNPPYIRLEDVPERLMSEYRRRCRTMRGRADVYVGFIEHGLQSLRDGGRLGFICADRWMHNQYGARLRALVTDSSFAVDGVVTMHDVDAFEEEVSAYPAVIVLRRGPQRDVCVAEANARFAEDDSALLTRWSQRSRSRQIVRTSFTASREAKWFAGHDLWPSASPRHLAMLRHLETTFPPLEDRRTETRVGIGVATGCDEVFITRDPDLVEEERLLPLLRAEDVTEGQVAWSNGYLVNPWTDDGLVDLREYPRMRRYLESNQGRLRSRHVAKRRPDQWYRTY